MRLNTALQRIGLPESPDNLGAMINYFRLDFEIHKFYAKFSKVLLRHEM